MGVLHHLHPILFFSKSNEGHLISGLSTGGKYPEEPTSPVKRSTTETNPPAGACCGDVGMDRTRAPCLLSFGFMGQVWTLFAPFQQQSQ